MTTQNKAKKEAAKQPTKQTYDIALTNQLNKQLTDYAVYKAVAPHISEPTLDASASNLIDRILLVVGTVTFVALMCQIILTLGGK